MRQIISIILEEFIENKIKDIYNYIKTDMANCESIFACEKIRERLKLYEMQLEENVEQENIEKIALTRVIAYYIGFVENIISVYIDGNMSKEQVAEKLCISIMELEELLIHITFEKSSEMPINDYLSYKRQNELVKFGELKAYCNMVKDNYIDIETAANKLNISKTELERILKKA